MLVAIPTKIEDLKRFGNKPVANSTLVIANVVLFTFAQTPAWAIAPVGSVASRLQQVPSFDIFRKYFAEAECESAYTKRISSRLE